MGDSRRFNLLARFIIQQYPKQFKLKIADVAGGKGYLNQCLKEHGYLQVVTFDDRGNRCRNINYQRRWFTDDIKEQFDLIVGMHPDEATDVIIREAHKKQADFIIVPCCIKPTEWAFWGHGFIDWLHHLEVKAERLGFTTQRSKLNMAGRNVLIHGRNNGKL